MNFGWLYWTSNPGLDPWNYSEAISPILTASMLEFPFTKDQSRLRHRVIIALNASVNVAFSSGLCRNTNTGHVTTTWLDWLYVWHRPTRPNGSLGLLRWVDLHNISSLFFRYSYSNFSSTSKASINKFKIYQILILVGIIWFIANYFRFLVDFKYLWHVHKLNVHRYLLIVK